MRRLRLSRHARADLEEIRDFMAADDPRAAERVLRRIFDSLRVVQSYPEAGAPRPRLGRQVRCAIAHPYLAFYEAEGDDIHVLRILHGARRVTRRLLRQN